jgi:hypothetical protein
VIRLKILDASVKIAVQDPVQPARRFIPISQAAEAALHLLDVIVPVVAAVAHGAEQTLEELREAGTIISVERR